jgi:uncharacterized protein YdbL (DUF1318 family)
MADFRLAEPQPANRPGCQPEAIGRLRELGDTYLAALDVAREASLELAQEVQVARAAGHSFQQLSQASGLSIATIQNILIAVSVERTSSKS